MKLPKFKARMPGATKQFVFALAKGTGWGAATYASYSLGAGIKWCGEELSKDPSGFFIIPALALMLVGDTVKVASIIPGVGVALNALDAVGAVVKTQPEDEDV